MNSDDDYHDLLFDIILAHIQIEARGKRRGDIQGRERGEIER
jgi:hypothetical protein